MVRVISEDSIYSEVLTLSTVIKTRWLLISKSTSLTTRRFHVADAMKDYWLFTIRTGYLLELGRRVNNMNRKPMAFYREDVLCQMESQPTVLKMIMKGLQELHDNNNTTPVVPVR